MPTMALGNRLQPVAMDYYPLAVKCWPLVTNHHLLVVNHYLLKHASAYFFANILLINALKKLSFM